MTRYFFRLDDMAPKMNWENFYAVISVFEKHDVKPLIAVIPDNRDPKLLNWPASPEFWQEIKELKNRGWAIGQHGWRHLPTGNGGVLRIHKTGEFGGLNFANQNEMIREGKEIMRKNGFMPEIFIAPRHSLDKNTVGALKENGFKFISDGIALYPFEKWGIVWLPQILWRPRRWLFGKITVALHPNTMSAEDIEKLEEFISRNRKKIGDFSELADWYSSAGRLKKISAFFANLFFKPVWRLIFRLRIKN